jgi:hypothetical protein
MLKSNRPKKEIIIYQQIHWIVFILIISLLYYIWYILLPGDTVKWFSTLLIIPGLMQCLILIKKLQKRPLFRMTHNGFYYDAAIVSSKPEFFEWEEVKSIKIAKSKGVEWGWDYNIRIYLSDRYIEVNEYSFPDGRHGAIKIFSKYHNLVGEEELID